jgi:hypothetical protein
MKRPFSNLKALAIAMLFCLSASIANATTLYLRSTSTADMAIELGNIAKITFGDVNVTVDLTDNSLVEIPLTDFKSLRTNTNGTPGDQSAVSNIVVSSSEQWNVYDISGNFVGTTNSIVKDGASLSSSLTPGIYIVKSNSQTLKLIVR